MSKKSKVTAAPADDTDYQAQSDADTMLRHQEIVGDPDRHQKASDHLEKKLGMTQKAHHSARKQLEKKTKGRLKKTFGNADGAEQAGPAY